MPWAYVRRAIAQRWQCRPWEVDEAPTDEVLLELKIMEIEGKAESAENEEALSYG